MFRATSLSIVLVLLTAISALGQVTLERKLPESSKYHLETSTKTTQRLTINGTDIDTSGDSRSSTLVSWGKRESNGQLVAEHQVESLSVTATVMGDTYQFDSTNPDNKGSSALEVLRELHKAAAKRSTRYIYNSDNRVERVETESILGAIPEQIQNMVKGEFDPETIKRTTNDELDQLKSDPVKTGDTWQRDVSQNLGAGQSMLLKMQYEYAGTVEKDGKKLDKITGKILAIDFALQDSPLPLTLKSSKLAAPESETTILFDRESGQTVEVVSNNHITGELTFVINNTELPSKLDLKMESSAVLKP